MGEYLTTEQIEKFEKDGILVIDNFLSQDEVKDMRKEILKLVQDMNPEEHRGVFSTTDNNKAQVLMYYNQEILYNFYWFCLSPL